MQTITWKTVAGLLQRHTKLIDVEAEQERIKFLVHDAAMMTASTEWLVWTETKIKVENGLAELPCDLLRLLAVFDTTGCELPAKRKGNYYPAPFKSGEIVIHYYAIPLVKDENGDELPLLYYELRNWYIWHVIKTFMYDEWMQGNINGQQFAYNEEMANNYFDDAMGKITLISISELEQALYMNRRGIYFKQ